MRALNITTLLKKKDMVKIPNKITLFSRLWICNKTPTDIPAPQQIGYLNIVPACVSQGGFLAQTQFESFAETIQKFNAMIAQQPIPGIFMVPPTRSVEGPFFIDQNKTCWDTFCPKTFRHNLQHRVYRILADLD